MEDSWKGPEQSLGDKEVKVSRGKMEEKHSRKKETNTEGLGAHAHQLV